MVDLELYRIFKIVADEENLTKASEILHISQPAVTKHIKNLENELNVKLFKRSKYGMILNENGQKLYLQIKGSIDVLSKAEDIFNMHKEINLGVHVNMPTKIYSNAILKFYESNQNSIINIHQLTAENMFSMLEKQKIDFAFSKKYGDELYDPKEIKFIKIGELHDVFIVNANSKYLNKKLSKKDLRNITIYTLKKFSSAYQNLIKELEYSEKDTINVDNVNYSAMLELLKVRDIVTVITKEYVEEKLSNNELCVLDVGFSLPNAEFGLYYNVNNNFKELKDVIKVLRDNCKV
ncbi:MAG: LysR family transcriptional regulator [Clostridia bacterium]|nr:LysR family transcriptional regulator [Clostridia bacterium]